MLRPLRQIAPAVVATLVCAFCPHFVLCQATNSGLKGNWAGILDIVHSDGSVEPDVAYFTLTQAGENVTGVAGISPAHMGTVSGGKLTGNNLWFDLAVNPPITVKFSLSLEADRLRGTATGLPIEAGSSIVVDLRRADAAWHSASAVAHAQDRLFDTIAGLDQRLFDAYNKCDLQTLGTMVTRNIRPLPNLQPASLRRSNYCICRS